MTTYPGAPARTSVEPDTAGVEGEVEERALYDLWPRQQQAMALFGFGEPDDPYLRDGPPGSGREPVEEMLYGGQAGGGKSLLARALALTIMSVWPNAIVGLFRRTYPELEDSHIRPIQRETAGTAFTWHEGRRELRGPNGAVCLFRYCDNREDLGHYQSAEFDVLIIDESTHFPGDWIEFLRARVRSTRPGWRPIILYTTNPGGLSHAYHKKQFIDPHPPGTVWVAEDEDGGLRRVFHQAKLEDNPALASEYRRRLLGIKDEQLRRALLHGDWNTLGAQFFPEWQKETHTVPSFRVPAHWRERVIGVDFGYGAPWSCHFYARDEDLWKESRTARWYVYRERYEKGVRDHEQASWIRDMVERDRDQTKRRASRPPRFTMFCDPAIWTKQPNGLSVSDVYSRALGEVNVTPQPANNDRLSGWSRVRDYFAPLADGYPAVVYMDCCPQAIATIPSLQRSSRDPEDADTRGDDHACDELRYVLMGVGAPTQGLDSRGPDTHTSSVRLRPPSSPGLPEGAPQTTNAGGVGGRGGRAPLPKGKPREALFDHPGRPQYPGGSQPALLSPQQQAHMARFSMALRAASGITPRNLRPDKLSGLSGRFPEKLTRPPSQE